MVADRRRLIAGGGSFAARISAVTAFAVTEVFNAITGEMEEVELAGFPSAVESEAVVPRWQAQPGGVNCDMVNVVPNPYRGTAEWDLIPSERDPTGRGGGAVGALEDPPDPTRPRNPSI